LGQIDSLLVKEPYVYTGGDRRINVSNLFTGEMIATITRDSGEITTLFEKDSELISCSSNGSIRTFGLTHTGLNIKMVSCDLVILFSLLSFALRVVSLLFPALDEYNVGSYSGHN
jgi:hypothetical protein